MNGYQNPFFNPYGFMQQQPAQPAPQQVDKVNGRNGAMQYAIGANSSAWVLDQSGVLSWLITTDSAGYKTITAYDIVPHQDAPAPDYGSLETRIQKLEEYVNANARNTNANRKKQSDDGTD